MNSLEWTELLEKAKAEGLRAWHNPPSKNQVCVAAAPTEDSFWADIRELSDLIGVEKAMGVIGKLAALDEATHGVPESESNISSQ